VNERVASEPRAGAALRAPHTLTFSYRRSVGGGTERFLAGLATGEIWGSVLADGRVTVPPAEYDPATGATVDRFVRVSDQGEVKSWTWVGEPGPEHPLDRPFAFALVALDGADTALLHVVDVTEEREMSTGMRVRADWRANRAGSVLDIRAFVPAGAAGAVVPSDDAPADALGPEPIAVPADMALEYTYEPGLALSGFFRALAERRIEGGRCPECASVYVPPRTRCPRCRVGPLATVAVVDHGVIESYTVVHIPFHGMTIDLPYAWAYIKLDGADVPFAHLLGEVAPDDIAAGQRVEAVWAAGDDRAPTWESIRYFRPVGPPPDAHDGSDR
jgi:uncharacterized OB-fold protein